MRTASFQLVVWLTPSFLAGAIAVSFVGLFLGPMYPVLMTFVGRTVSRPLVSGVIGTIGASGSAGATFLPYFTATLAEDYGIIVLQPL